MPRKPKGGSATTTTPTGGYTDAPLYAISPHYYDRPAVSKLPVLKVYIPPSTADDAAAGAIEHVRARPAVPARGKYLGEPAQPAEWRVKGLPELSFDELLAQDYARGERDALLVTLPEIGLIDVVLPEDEFTGSSTITPPQFMRLSRHLAGMASLIGYDAVLKVLHPNTLLLLIEGALDDYSRRARHDAAVAKKFAATTKQLEPMLIEACEHVVASDGKHFEGTAEEFAELQARAAQFLNG